MDKNLVSDRNGGELGELGLRELTLDEASLVSGGFWGSVIDGAWVGGGEGRRFSCHTKH